MRRFGRYLLFAIAFFFLGGVAVFMIVEGSNLADALFSAFTIFVTGDPGSLHFDHVSPITKIYASLLMVLGAVAVATVFGLVADFLLSHRIEQLLGKGLTKMTDHVIVCGLGQTGYGIWEELQHFGDQVCIVEKADNDFTHKLRKLDVKIVLGDLAEPDTLVEADIHTAKSVIVASDDDLVNVEIALNVKELRPDVNVVLKMFDQRMAKKLQEAFGIRAAFSATALAAPAFAAASHCDSVLDSMHLDEDLLVTAELELAAGSPLAKTTPIKLRKEHEFTILRFQGKGRSPEMHPRDVSNWGPGDKVVLVCCLEVLEALQALNKPVKAAL